MTEVLGMKLILNKILLQHGSGLSLFCIINPTL